MKAKYRNSVRVQMVRQSPCRAGSKRTKMFTVTATLEERSTSINSTFSKEFFLWHSYIRWHFLFNGLPTSTHLPMGRRQGAEIKFQISAIKNYVNKEIKASLQLFNDVNQILLQRTICTNIPSYKYIRQKSMSDAYVHADLNIKMFVECFEPCMQQIGCPVEGVN